MAKSDNIKRAKKLKDAKPKKDFITGLAKADGFEALFDELVKRKEEEFAEYSILYTEFGLSENKNPKCILTTVITPYV